MRKVLILTKTNWDEPPRIRHQVTRMLKKHGYQITFIEKCSYKSFLVKERMEEGITFYSHPELIHHQLRQSRFIQRANNALVKFYLKKIIHNLEFDFVINFCYDYSFLPQLAGNKKIITIINDDFEAQAKLGMEKQIRLQTQATCMSSDHVLTVSYPLYDKLKTYRDNVTLFFPWSQKKYKKPKNSLDRNTVLYWGFIGRMDWPMIERIINNTNYHYRFIGPPDRNEDKKMVDFMTRNHANFEHIPYSAFNELKSDDVFCSIIPYNPNKESVQACTISNKAFNLLSLGLPLVYADLRHLIEAPSTVMKKNKSLEEYVDTLNFYKNNFDEVQNDIELFLHDHYEEKRWLELERIMNS
ncbi:hypothetical protein [Flagellimonas marinaquae]|uniref:hypothetical protein n=1 Tax=Flagellimonas marinaquae TaxID=254955 RepID=UPI002075BD5E|nr:hypothetical protein [Allomuricauda aquimarina]USD26667.1 hypothetical protein MJO53_07160 [Allomuricauda aquimarina]